PARPLSQVRARTGRHRLPGDVPDRSQRAHRRPAALPGHAEVAGRAPAEAAGGEVMKLAAILVVFALFAPQASLPDIEDEVMCVECGTVLSVSNSPVRWRRGGSFAGRLRAARTRRRTRP